METHLSENDMANGLAPGKVDQGERKVSNGSGISLKEIVAAVAFVVLVGPALIGVGNLWARVGHIENDMVDGVLPKANTRITVLETKTATLERSLRRMEVKLDEVLAAIK